MRTYEDPDSEDYNPEAVEADRALGRRAAEIVREQKFAEFTELAHTGAGCYEPHLIYRHGDSFLIVDTEVSDGQEKRSVYGQGSCPMAGSPAGDRANTYWLESKTWGSDQKEEGPSLRLSSRRCQRTAFATCWSPWSLSLRSNKWSPSSLRNST